MSGLGCVRKRDSEQARGSGSLCEASRDLLSMSSLFSLQNQPGKLLIMNQSSLQQGGKVLLVWVCPSSGDGGWHFGGFLGVSSFLLLLTTTFFGAVFPFFFPS